MSGITNQYGDLAGALKIIYVWAKNPSNDVLKDLELIKDKAEDALKKVGLM